MKPAPQPKDRRLPLALVEFRIPVELPGVGAHVPKAVSGEEFPAHLHTDPSRPATCPQIYLDPEMRSVVIGDSLYPYDGAMVKRIVRARAARG